jgi:[ribosomal protein S18]-alanine N-acetyltransferase
MLRLANQDDLPFLREMLFEAAHWDSSKPRPSLEEGLRDPIVASYLEGWVRPGDGGLVAMDDESMKAIGAAWYRLFTEDKAGFGFVDELTPELAIAVLEEFRGKHVGSALMNGLRRLAKAQGHRRLSLAVEPRNVRARLLNAKMGFREVRNDGSTIVLVANLDVPAPAGMN